MSQEHIFDKSLPTKITEVIENWIFQGKYKPGDSLKEKELATIFGTSQTPIREAFRILEERDIIQHQKNKGSKIIDFTLNDLKQILQVRIPLESLALELSRQNATEDEKKELLNSLNHLETFAHDDDLLRYHKTHTEFHIKLWESSKNKILTSVLQRLAVTQWTFYRYQLHNNKNRRLSGKKSHKLLIDYLYHKTTKSSHEIIKEHVGNVGGFRPETITQN